jgi:hypothetical protein
LKYSLNIIRSTFQGAGVAAGLVGHLAGVKISKEAYKILFIISEGKYLRNQAIHGSYVERTVKLPSTLIKLHALVT